MAKRPNDMRRGNDLLYKPRGEFDEFDHYLGPFGGDVRSSVRGPRGGTNRDELGEFQVQKQPKNFRGGPRKAKGRRGDEKEYGEDAE